MILYDVQVRVHVCVHVHDIVPILMCVHNVMGVRDSACYRTKCHPVEFHPAINSGTGWYKVPPAEPILPAVPAITRFYATTRRMRPPMGRGRFSRECECACRAGLMEAVAIICPTTGLCSS